MMVPLLIDNYRTLWNAVYAIQCIDLWVEKHQYWSRIWFDAIFVCWMVTSLSSYQWFFSCINCRYSNVTCCWCLSGNKIFLVNAYQEKDTEVATLGHPIFLAPPQQSFYGQTRLNPVYVLHDINNIISLPITSHRSSIRAYFYKSVCVCVWRGNIWVSILLLAT